MMPKHSWSAALGLKYVSALTQLHSGFELAQSIHWALQTKFASLMKQAPMKLLLTWLSMWQYNFFGCCLHRQDQNTADGAWKPSITCMFYICRENMNKLEF